MWLHTLLYTIIILIVLYDTARLINVFILLSKLERDVSNTTHSVMLAHAYMQEEILND